MNPTETSDLPSASLLRALRKSNELLQRDFLNAVKILSGLIDMRFSETAGHGRRCAELCESAGIQLNLSVPDRVQLRFGALLHSLGKMALSDAILATKPSKMRPDELEQWRRYPILSQEMLMGLEQFSGAAQIIRSHQERWDGAGFPDQLRGDAIPLGARVLAAAIQMDRLRHGWDCDRPLDPDEVTHRLQAQQGKRLCPEATEALIVSQRGASPLTGDSRAATRARKEVSVPLQQVAPGAVLARDLVGERGLLLLSANYELTSMVIQQLRSYEARQGRTLEVWIRL
jgi:response regulator RpfG family c-di-GMP phosphodiesterase